MKAVGLLTEEQTIKSSSLPITILTRIYISEVQLLKILLALPLTASLANGVNRRFGFLQEAFETRILKALVVSQNKVFLDFNKWQSQWLINQLDLIEHLLYTLGCLRQNG